MVFEKDTVLDIENEEVKKKIFSKGLYPIPIGCENEVCPKCGRQHLVGAIITETADEQDPNLLCLDCGF